MTEHIVPTRVYYLIFAALMVGTYLTVQAAFIDLGAFNTVVALAIACMKATLVDPVLHAREVQHPADVGGRRRQRLLAGDPARADIRRLPDAILADVRVTGAGVA